ncbi:MAG: selenium metabolism-associated LysR family transcriptional regulator [Eubacteriales bacterium]|nr:selenium metabolism-associated LysR family transcriptional regulator [Eubacteriales bacterium]
MNLKQLEAFVEVAEGGSFSRAAKSLYLTQPTISAHIASLEKELEVRLFVRNTKEVSLSPEGHTLYKYASQMVNLEKRIEEEFGERRKLGKQCITIAASTIPAQYLLPKILARFNEKYPGEQIRLMESDSSRVVNQVVEHMVDIGFTGTVLEKKHCKYIPFYKDELVIITPNIEIYQKRAETPMDISWIVDEPVIMREEGSGTRKEAEKQLRGAGIRPEQLNVIASIENQETIKKSVCGGMGISVLSKLAAADKVEDGSVLSFAIPGADKGRDINVVYNKNYQLSVSADRFLRTVKEVYLDKHDR